MTLFEKKLCKHKKLCKLLFSNFVGLDLGRNCITVETNLKQWLRKMAEKEFKQKTFFQAFIQNKLNLKSQLVFVTSILRISLLKKKSLHAASYFL